MDIKRKRVIAKNDFSPLCFCAHYHSKDPENASAIAIVILNEALTTIHFGIHKKAHPHSLLVKSTRSSVKNYISSLRSAFITPANKAPELPDRKSLRESDIPLIEKSNFTESVSDREKHRRELLGMIQADVRKWPD